MVTGLSVDDSLKQILAKVKCYLTDWAAICHLTVFLLENEWEMNLIEFNCNVHPLEEISSKTRKVLTNCEKQYTQIANVNECLA